MNFFQLFISLSCVSATVIPTLSGSSTEALATTMTEIMTSIWALLKQLNRSSIGKVMKNYLEVGISLVYLKNTRTEQLISVTFRELKSFIAPLVDNRCTEGYNILKGYFDSGVIADMVEMGWLKYQDIFDVALTEDNYNCVNLALDRLIAIHAPV